MHIMLASNYSAQSGYANVARMLAPRWQALGHRVTVFELGGRINRPTQIGDIQVLPPALDPLGNDIVDDHASRLRADAVISLTDAWGLNGDVWGRTPWFPYTPIDHMPPTPAVVNSIRHCQRPIAMSTFGYQQLKGVGFEPYYAPLPYDPDVFSPGDKVAARAALGFPQDVYLVAFVGVNDSVPSRKGIPELLTAWAMTTQQGRRDWMLYMHTAPTGNLALSPYGGVNIPQLMTTFGIDQNTVRLPDEYDYRTGIPQRALAELFRAADLLILPSRGEGFGLPLVEAQACGLTVATTNCAAQRELIFGGIEIDGEVEWTWQGATVVRPGVASIAEALEAGYELRGNPKQREMALRGAAEYAVDNVVAKYWTPVLTDMAARRLEALCASA